MAKVNISRLFEVSRYLTTPAGQQLKDALEYISTFSTETVRNLQQGLTFVDNFNSESKFVGLLPSTETVVLPSKKTRVTQVMIRQIIDDKYYSADGFGWKYDNNGNLVVKIIFSGSPPAATSINVELLIFYG